MEGEKAAVQAEVAGGADQQFEAAVLAGFESTDIETVDTATEEAATTTEPTEPATVEAAAEENPEPEPELAKLTKAELEALKARAEKVDELEAQLRKVSDKAFGKIGELVQKIEEARSSGRGINPKAKEKLSAEFPELAAALFGDDDGAGQEQQKSEVAAPKTAEEIERLRQEQTEYQQKLELRLLNRAHPDWMQVKDSPEFVDWIGKSLTADQRSEFYNTWDADIVSSRLDQFKQFAASQKQEVEPPASKKQNGRLEAAVTPKGMPRGSQVVNKKNDLESAMLEAFGET